MTCCCSKDKRIIIVRGDDTDFNDGNLVEFKITSSILTVSDFKAKIVLGTITKNYNDLSSGIIDYNLSSQESSKLPYGDINGTLYLISQSDKRATITNTIPFKVVSLVDINSIATSDVDYTINVEQGGETIFNIDVHSAVSVSVGTVETLPAGSDAYVENVSTDNHLVLNFGIPQGIQGEQGEQGPDGKDGSDGKDAKINGVNTLTLNTTYGISLSQIGSTATLSGKEITDVVDGISALIPAQATEQNQLADKNFVNSSIATNTANFIGTFNSVADLEAYSGPLTNNDYAFVVGTDSSGNTIYDRYKYTTATTPASWVFEYELNNSSFTASQWAAINSGATEENINQITINENAIGNLPSLNTSLKDNLVDAINEVNNIGKSKVDDVEVDGVSVVKNNIAHILGVDLYSGTNISVTNNPPYEIIGSLTINDGVVSGFSSNNYLKTKETLGDCELTDIGDKTIVEFACTFNQNLGSQYTSTVFISEPNSDGGQSAIFYHQESSKLKLAYHHTTGSTWIASSPEIVLPTNQKVYLRIIETKIDVNTLKTEVYLSYDNVSYTKESEKTLILSPSTGYLSDASNSKLYLGYDDNSYSSSDYGFFNGSLDIEYFKIISKDNSVLYLYTPKHYKISLDLTQEQWDALNSGATATNIGQITTNETAIGNLSTLTTTANTDLVSAINEVNSTAGSKVSDVQINNTSIVTSGVANISPVTLNGTYGVIKLGAGTGGLAINSSGNLYVVGASQGQTEAKLANINNPVMPGQIDTAVKAGLTTNTLTFTDAEKLAARTLIGAGTGNSNLILDIGTGLKETDGVQYDITGTPTITNGVLSGITDSNYLVTKGTLNSTLSNDGDSVQLDFSATVKTATVSTGNLYTIYVNGQNYLRIVQSSTGNRLQVQGRINNTNVVSVNSGTGVFPQNEKTYIRIKETRVSSSSYTFDVSYSTDGTTYTSVSSTSLTASCLGAFNGEKIAIGVLNTPSASGRGPFSNGDIDLKDFKVTKSDVPLPWTLNAKGGTLVQANLASSISSASTHEELVSAKLLYEELEKIKALI